MNDVLSIAPIQTRLRKPVISYTIPHSDTFSMRPEQRQCHDEAVYHFQNGGKQFLCNAIMGYGKSFVSYQIIKSLGYDRVLILTYKPAVQDSWANDFRGHADFSKWRYHFAHDFSGRKPFEFVGDSDTEILFASFQDLNEMNKAKWKNIHKEQFDLIVIDEQHFGSATPRAQETLANLNCDRVLEVSGTPLHALMSGKFFPHEIYTWSYEDQQARRQAEQATGWATEVYRWLPEMQFYIMEIDQSIRDQCANSDPNELFSIQKMFTSSDGVVFDNQSAVESWLEYVYGQKHTGYESPLLQHPVDHMIWRLPSVNACMAMERLLKSKGYVTHAPIVVSGTDGADIDQVRDYIAVHDQTITLSCGSLMTGVTVPEWTMIFMLEGGSSPQEYFQTVFRVQRSNRPARKEKCYVVDFNPHRTLQMVYEYAFVQSETNGKSINQNVANFLKFTPILDNSNNRTVQIDVNDVLGHVADAQNAIDRFNYVRNINIQNVTPDVLNVLAGVDKKTSNKREVVVNNSGGQKGKSGRGKKKTTTGAANVDPMREVQQKAITVLNRLPAYLYIELGDNDQTIYSVQDIIDLANDELLEQELGIDSAELELLCNAGFLNTKRLDLCITGFLQMYHGVSDKSKTVLERIDGLVSLSKYLYSNGHASATDFDLCMHMVAGFDYTNWDQKFLDPACGKGMFLFAIIRNFIQAGCPVETALNMIHGMDSDPSQMQHVRANFRMVFGHVPNTLRLGDSLLWDWNMEFDGVVTNPPYKGNSFMHQKFFNKCVDMVSSDGLAVILQPALPYFYKKKQMDSHTRSMINKIEYYTTSTELVSPTVFTEATVVYDLSITYLTKTIAGHDELESVTYKNGDLYENIPVNQVNHMEIEPALYKSIVDKYRAMVSNTGSVFDSMVKTGPRALIPRIYSGPCFIPKSYDSYEFYENSDSVWQGVSVSDEAEMKNVYDYLTSNTARFGLAIFKYSNYILPCDMALTPLVDFSRTYEEDELYQMMGFTDEETQVIESVIPWHYDRRPRS